MHTILLAIALATSTPPTVSERLAKLSFEWAVELTVTDPRGGQRQFYYFNGERGLMRLHGPKDWVCGFKVDEMRVTEIQGQPVFFQNAFVGCSVPQIGMFNTGGNASVVDKIIIEKEANFIYGPNNEYSARLIPCIEQYKNICNSWKMK